MSDGALSCEAKALAINLAPRFYGTVAAIGGRVRSFVYPSRSSSTDVTTTAHNTVMPAAQQRLFEYLLASERIVAIDELREDLFDIVSTSVLSGIRSGDSRWESQVPAAVATLIQERGLFSYPV